MKILMVCLGNICRSPIAEGVLRHKAALLGLSWTVDSAGTNGIHVGASPHRHSQEVCRQHGIDISYQRGRQFIPEDLTRFDKIYVLADDVYREVRRIAGPHADLSKVDYLMNELHPGSDASVPDPWYGDRDGYLPVFQMIDKACTAIIEKYGVPAATQQM